MRPGQRCLRDPVGRQGTAWPELLRRGPGRLEPGVLQEQVRHRRQWPGQPPDPRLGLGHRARRGRRLGGDARALRQAALRRPDGAGDRDRRARLRRAAGGGAQVGRRGARAERPAGLRRDLHAQRPRAAGWREIHHEGCRRDAAQDRRDPRPRLLRGRDRREDRRLQQAVRRRDDAGRPAQLPPRLGQAHQQGLPRLRAARDPAQWPGHCRAGCAGHPQPVRHGLDPGRLGRFAAPAN
ncbi:hypothetical protein D9M72_491970 [compost metagenome]